MIDPKTDGPGQRQQLRIAINDLIENLGTFRNCITCTWFNEQNIWCTQEKHNASPPPRIIAYGCEDHSDLIPF